MPTFTVMPSLALTAMQRIRIASTFRPSAMAGMWRVVGGMLTLLHTAVILAAVPTTNRPPPSVTGHSVVVELDELFLPDRGDSIVLTTRGREQLDALARDLLQSTRDVAGVTLTGHVDHCGTDGYTLLLSLERAETARTYLREQGVLQPMAIEEPGTEEMIQTHAAAGGCQGRGSGLRVQVRLRGLAVQKSVAHQGE